MNHHKKPHSKEFTVTFCRPLNFLPSLCTVLLLSSAVSLGDGTPWTYKGKGGPDSWARLSPSNEACAAGRDQSPINLRQAAKGEGDQLKFFYQVSPLKSLNTGHGLQVPYELGSYFENGKGRFELLQFHFHTPSEHTIEGKGFPLEMHLVHRNTKAGSAQSLAVVGVMFRVGAENPSLETLLTSVPIKSGETARLPGVYLNVQEWLPKETSYFYYPGSLTTPPCSEGVAWHVIKTPLEASASQLKKMAKTFGVNARPIQPLNNRVLRFQP